MRINKIKHLVGKVYDRGSMLCVNFFRLGSYYSWKYAFYDLMDWIGFYGRKQALSMRFVKKKQEWIDCYIESKYPDVVNRYRTAPESDQKADDFKIWVFWAQGKGQMPTIVKACYKQLCRKNGPENVVLLDLTNVSDYVSIPEKIYEKLRNGSLLYAHFSDILRQTLIAKHGGFWIDATCWTGRAMPEELKRATFISPHNEKDGTYWCTYALGSCLKKSVTFSFVRDMLTTVCLKEKVWPDYLFQDRLLDFAKRKIAASKHAIEITPPTAHGAIYFIHR